MNQTNEVNNSITNFDLKQNSIWEADDKTKVQGCVLEKH